MKKILLVTHWFYPSQTPRAYRAYELYKQLKKEKYDVDVLIGNGHILLENNDSIQEKYKIDGNKTREKRSKLYGAISPFKNLFDYFFGDRFFIKDLPYMKKSIKKGRYDCIISIGLPFYVHYAVYLKFRNYTNKPVLIADCGDPFYGRKEKKLAFYFKYMQKAVFNFYDYITIPTKVTLNYYKDYVDNDKIKIIPQAIDLSSLKLATYKPNNITTFAYAGIFYKEIRNPEELLKTLVTVPFDFKFIIYTIKHGEIYENIISKYENILGDKLEVYEMIPRDICIYELSKCDFLVNIENRTGIQSPSKLIDYASTGRPIFSTKDNEVNMEVLINFINKDYSHSYKGINVSDYDTITVTNKFINLFEGNTNQ